jgi:hypothetical protein
MNGHTRINSSGETVDVRGSYANWCCDRRVTCAPYGQSTLAEGSRYHGGPTGFAPHLALTDVDVQTGPSPISPTTMAASLACVLAYAGSRALQANFPRAGYASSHPSPSGCRLVLIKPRYRGRASILCWSGSMTQLTPPKLQHCGGTQLPLPIGVTA